MGKVGDTNGRFLPPREFLASRYCAMVSTEPAERSCGEISSRRNGEVQWKNAGRKLSGAASAGGETSAKGNR